MKAILVTGSRDWNKPQTVFDELTAERPNVVIHGACKDPKTGELIGADKWADIWARSESGVEPIPMPAQWDRYPHERRRQAGPDRNRSMCKVLNELRNCGYDVLVLAFPLEDSRGTRNCVQAARGLGLPVRVVKG